MGPGLGLGGLEVRRLDALANVFTLRVVSHFRRADSTRAARAAHLGPQGCLARVVHVPFAQESRVQVRGRNGRDDDGACLLRKGVPGHLGNLGAWKARIFRSGGE
jgi:hypothetical protein